MDFYFSHKRNKDAAYQFLKRCLRYYDADTQPNTLNTDKHSSYAHAILRLKKEGRLRVDVEQRQMKYLNNGIDSDHASIKKLVVGTGSFKIRKRAWSTIQGFESLRMLNKGQFDFWLHHDDCKTLVRERSAFMNRLFNVEVIYQ